MTQTTDEDRVIERLAEKIDGVRICGNAFEGERQIDLEDVERIPKNVSGNAGSIQFDALLSRCWGDYPNRFKGVYIVRFKGESNG